MLRALVREKPIGEQRDRTNLASPWAKSWLYERKPSTVLFWLMVVYPFAWSSTRFRVAKEIFPVAAKFSHVSYGSMRQIIGQICSSMETVKPGLAGGGGGYGRSTAWITPKAVREALDTCPELEACVLAICGVLTARDRGLCDESTQAELLGHMSKVTGRGKYLGPHSYGALAWGVGHKEGTLPGSQYLEMGEGFDASRIRRLVKIAADVPAFNRLVRGVLPGWRTLDWRDVAYLFCMNGGSLGIATETTTPTGPRRSHVTGSERLWLALERIAVDKRHLASCIRTHVICM